MAHRLTRQAARVLPALVLWSTAASAAIEGRVVARDGTPLAGAALAAYPPETSQASALRMLAGRPRTALATAVTDRDGAFRLETRLTLVGVEARAPGFAPAFAAAAGDHPLTLQARPAKPMRALVTVRGRPLSGALVVWTGGSLIGPIAEMTARTSEDGSYEVPDPTTWAHYGLILHPDFAPRDLSPHALGGLAHEMEDGVPVHGNVVDPDGRPVSGVTVWTGGRAVLPLARSSDDGTFRIDHVPPSWVSLVARLGTRVGVADRASNPVTIVLRPGGSISGQVRDEAGGPVAEAAVAFGDFRGADAPVLTAPDGSYTVEGMPPREYRGHAGRPGYASEPTNSHDSRSTDLTKAPAGRRDFVLTRLRVVTGRVVDEADEPVPRARVSLAAEGPVLYAAEHPGFAERTARTSADGRFALTLHPALGHESAPVEGVVIVLRDGYAAGRVPLPAASEPLTVKLVRGVELKGRLTTADGTPVSGVGIRVVEDGEWAGTVQRSDRALATDRDREWTSSDADGRYSVRVHPGVHHVAFHKAGFAAKVVTGFDAAGGPRLDVVLEPGVRVAGRVARPSGSGVPMVEVVISGSAGDLARTTTDGRGGFDFSGLAPGPYEVRIHDNVRGIAQSRPIQAPVEDLELTVDAAGTLRGRVVDAKTREPVTSYYVGVEWEIGLHGGSRDLNVSSPTGSFAFSNLPARNVSVEVHAAGYVPAKVKVALAVAGGAGEQVIALVTDAPIRGRVTYEGGAGLATAYVVARNAAGDHVSGARADADGRFEVRGLAPGPIALTFHAPGFARATRTVAEAGRAATVEVGLDHGLTLRGEVLLDGSPVRGAVVTLPPEPNEPPKTAETDEHGQFGLEGLVPGRYSVRAHVRPPERATAVAENIEVPARQPLRLVLARRQTATLKGAVKGLERDDTSTVTIVVRNDSDERTHVQAGPDFTFGTTDAPVGRLRVTGWANTRSRGTRAARTSEIAVGTGATADVTVEFSSDVVQGVVTRGGQPVPYVYVSFSTPQLIRASGRTDAAGRYEAVGLEPGRHRVDVSGNDVMFTTEATIAVPGSFDIDVTEPPTSTP